MGLFMDRIRAYLEAIEEINRAERRLSKQRDATGVALLESALDAAKAAWLLIPTELRLHLEPPPEPQRLRLAFRAPLESVREL
jgi:hypothetical protein